MPCEYNNERNAWAANNLAPFDMPFLSIIAYRIAGNFPREKFSEISEKNDFRKYIS